MKLITVDTMRMKRNRILKLVFLLFPILFIYACSTSNSKYLVYVGTYTGHGSDGIYAYHFNPGKGELSSIGLVAKTDNPSFFTIDSAGRFLYAVNELDTFQNKPVGAVSVFEINRESGELKLLQQISSLGAAPAHLSLDKTGRFLLVANYTGGNVAVFPVGSDGKLGPFTFLVQDSGASINPDRQRGPHAHFIGLTNDNTIALTADLGNDKVLFNRFDAVTGSLTPAGNGFIKMEPGSGPRHIAFAPSGNFIYVLNELTSTITVVDLNTESVAAKTVQTISALPDGFTGENTTAEIVADAKGKFLYVSNRGDNSIGQFNIHPSDGSLTPVGWVSSGGKSPRNFEIAPDGKWLFAANQNSGNIVLFSIGETDGKLKQISDSTKIDSPVCIRFIKPGKP